MLLVRVVKGGQQVVFNDVFHSRILVNYKDTREARFENGIFRVCNRSVLMIMTYCPSRSQKAKPLLPVS